MDLRMYKFRLYPSQKQKGRLLNNFRICKSAYNELLAISKDAYEFGNVSLTKSDYQDFVKGTKNVHSQVIQDVGIRLHKAFQNFFRRVKDKSCKRKGFPRFKSRVNSITYPQSGFKFLNARRLKVSKIGNIPIVLHRVPKGKVKTLTIKVNMAGHWFACFSCEITNPTVKHPSNKRVGLDLGIENFAVLSDGKVIDNPRFLIKSEKRLKILQRRLSRKKRGSVNRRKARLKVTKQHITIVNQRTDFLHKLTRSLAFKYSQICVEDLNIKGMVHNHHLAKHINDASWNAFVQLLSYKAVNCGGQFIKVNPRNTSKTCSKCGAVMDMPLSKRKFQCSNCGFVCHRDLNASINILKVGLVGKPKLLNACEHNVRPSLKAVVDEAGTIRDNS